MTVIRRCNRKGCAYEAADVGPGVNGFFITFPLDNRDVDLCPNCTKTLKEWIEGVHTLELPTGVRSA